MAELDGVWDVERTGGALPPLVGVTKEIRGGRGWTTVASVVGLGFDVRGRELRYRGPLASFVDELEPEGPDFRGRATFRGRQFGTFVLRRRSES